MNTVPIPRFAPRPFRMPRGCCGFNRYHLSPRNAPLRAICTTATAKRGTHAPGISQRQMLEVEINVMDKNNQIAAATARAFAARKQLVAEHWSQPRLGKTTLLTETLKTPERARLLRGD